MKRELRIFFYSLLGFFVLGFIWSFSKSGVDKIRKKEPTDHQIINHKENTSSANAQKSVSEKNENEIERSLPKTKEKPLNVLFIAVDDLRPELGCYGKSQIYSPNIDKLADQGFLFERAYSNAPVCGASRASILTGLRPSPSRFLTHKSYIDVDAPNVVTMPKHFKNNGYASLSLGKILHNWNEDALDSWSETPWHPRVFEPGSWEQQRLNYLRPENFGTRAPIEKAGVADTAYLDGKIANRAIKELQRFAESDQPFFIAMGFVKPHLPFNAPAKYWDLYDPNKIEFPEFMEYPENVPDEARHNSSELRTYDDIPKEGPLSDAMARSLMHGYYACVSYVDAQIGRVMEELKRLGLEENTIVVVWGDHGWSLREHGLWCKHSTYNIALHTPLIVKIPNKKGGQKIKALTELVDLYPSLCDLAGLSRPYHLQGDSFAYLIENPNAKGKDAIFGRWVDADLIKTDRYLYTEWYTLDGRTKARMLYDHHKDPDETVNIAERYEHTDMVKDFSNRLQRQRKIQ
ncbi:sulfatase [Flagellimonas flava]|uniref:Arylsulfatase A n=1 Tax=Flagellimonas flava TaxID=570519 RepID=A0A1M5NLR4_9FLAO|nr:sulfatase [Allomuricauda flava]SHG90481.1 Arylsulfatase A [Allomuricauda flava]